jgi:transcriptional regulator with XRE-family HTH domain
MDAMETEMHLKFADKLNIVRRSQSLTIGALASKSGVNESTMERICQGQGAPSARMAWGKLLWFRPVCEEIARGQIILSERDDARLMDGRRK